MHAATFKDSVVLSFPHHPPHDLYQSVIYVRRFPNFCTWVPGTQNCGTNLVPFFSFDLSASK